MSEKCCIKNAPTQTRGVRMFAPPLVSVSNSFTARSGRAGCKAKNQDAPTLHQVSSRVSRELNGLLIKYFTSVPSSLLLTCWAGPCARLVPLRLGLAVRLRLLVLGLAWLRAFLFSQSRIGAIESFIVSYSRVMIGNCESANIAEIFAHVRPNSQE